MPRTSEQANAEVRAGWAALAEGRWDEARDRFTAALAETELPEAVEGLSWSAWWRDDVTTVFEARERAFRLYRARGDAAAAARMATWLAIDELDFHGAAAVASGWIRRAHRLLEPLEPGPEHGWLAFHEGFLAHGAGDSDAARASAREAAAIGRRLQVVDLEMLGLALEGAALVASAQVEEGMRCLDEATAIALEDEAAIPIAGAWTCCFLVSACTAVLDLERAAEWCDRIAEFSERYGSRYMLAFCRAEYGRIHLERGDWGEAERMLEAAVADFSASRPAWVQGPLTTLAELRRRQGRDAEAAQLLDGAGSTQGAQLARARLALDRGDAGRAVELLERLDRRAAPDGVERVPLLALLVRARAARGDHDAAAEALASLRATADAIGTPLVAAAADAAEGVLLAARGEHEEARVRLEDAVDCYDERGAPFDAAQTRVELATTLVALGRAEDAAREVRAARAALEALGADAAHAARIGDASSPRAGDAPLPVTAREREVLALVAEGLTNRQIAERLVVSEHTVHRHVTNILRKLELPSRTAAAALAVRAGIVGRAGT